MFLETDVVPDSDCLSHAKYVTYAVGVITRITPIKMALTGIQKVLNMSQTVHTSEMSHTVHTSEMSQTVHTSEALEPAY